MAQNDLIKRLLDAGVQFTQMTQKRAEALVADLVKAGEVQAEQAQTFVSDLIERSRKNSDELVDRIRTEVRNQVAALDLVTKDVVARLEQQLEAVRKQLPMTRAGQRRAARSAPAKKTPAKKTPMKKSAAKRSAAKAAAKKAPAKRTAAKKAAG